MGVRMYGSPLTNEKIATARRIYEAGQPLRVAAAEVGRVENTVRVALIRAGVVMRNQQSRARLPMSSSGARG